MLNRFQRCASKYPYYGYLNLYTSTQLRTYQSEQYYILGRRGAFDNLIYKMAATHINYEEDFNLRYKVPPVLVNLSMRLAWYWFVVPTFMISFMLGDMNRLFNFHTYTYLSSPGEDAEAPTRY